MNFRSRVILDRPRLAPWTVRRITAAVRGRLAEGGRVEARRHGAGARTGALHGGAGRVASQGASQLHAKRALRRDRQSDRPAIRLAGRVQYESSSPSWVGYRHGAGPLIELGLVARKPSGRQTADAMRPGSGFGCQLSEGPKTGLGGAVKRVTRRSRGASTPIGRNKDLAESAEIRHETPPSITSVTDGALLAQTVRISSFVWKLQQDVAFRAQLNHLWVWQSCLVPGTGSYPHDPHGLQRAIRLAAIHPPLKAPCFCRASNAYALHVG